jgi:hypothetical protein
MEGVQALGGAESVPVRGKPSGDFPAARDIARHNLVRSLCKINSFSPLDT